MTSTPAVEPDAVAVVQDSAVQPVPEAPKPAPSGTAQGSSAPKPTAPSSAGTRPAPKPSEPDTCGGMRWRPPRGAAKGKVTSSAKRQIRSGVEQCLEGLDDDGVVSTTVQVYVTAAGAACGMAIDGHGASDAKVRACMHKAAASASIPPLASGDYGLIEFTTVVNK